MCNLNYKLRPLSAPQDPQGPDGRTLAILEVNPRIGGDLVCDVPLERARALLERVEAWGMRGVASPSDLES